MVISRPFHSIAGTQAVSLVRFRVVILVRKYSRKTTFVFCVCLFVFGVARLCSAPYFSPPLCLIQLLLIMQHPHKEYLSFLPFLLSNN